MSNWQRHKIALNGVSYFFSLKLFRYDYFHIKYKKLKIQTFFS